MTQPVNFSVGIKKSHTSVYEHEKGCENQKTKVSSNPFISLHNKLEDIVFKYLPPSSLCEFSLTSRACGNLTLPRRKEVINETIQDIQHFRGILPIEPFDNTRADNLNYCNDYICRVKDQIKADHEFRKIFISCKENFAATAQEIKDRDLIRVFKKIAPDFLLQQENVSNHEKAQAIRAHLETLPENDPLFQRQVLVLSGLHLTSIPPEIGRFVHLQGLDISENQIQVIPPEMGNLVNLQRLWLAHNQIQVIPPEIGNLPQLEKFSLFNNPIQEVPPEMNRLIEAGVLLFNPQIQTNLPEEHF